VSEFILICAAMILAAIVLVLLPLVRKERAASGEQGAPAPKANAAALAFALALPVAAAVMYASISEYPWKQGPQAAAAGNPHETGDAGSMEQATAALEERLKDNPGDVEGWRMLGRSYLVTGRFQEAVGAYEKANAIVGGKDMELSLDIAEALILTEDPAVQDRARKIVAEGLAADPLNQKALWYSGILAMRDGDKDTAVARFNALLEQNPPDEIRQIIGAQLANLGQPAPADTAPAQPAAAQGAMGGMQQATSEPAVAPKGRTIRVAVSVDPSVAGKLKPGALIFVSARQPGIPGPPLAAVRLTTDELPTTVVLSDANSMIEGRNLSSVDDVQVVARVAFGGTAMTAPGDLLGDAIHKKGSAEDLAVVISRVQP
jgi:cytochrome c-type biogenesis protein CcmH